MEIFDLKYFVSIAKFENLHKAAEDLRVSPAGLSKAVGRLESELDVKLFHRVGRGIELTEQGHHLLSKATEIIRLESDARATIAGGKGAINVRIVGREVLLMEYSSTLLKTIKKMFPKAMVQIQASQDDDAIARVMSGEADLALISSNIPSELKGKIVKTFEFKVFAGRQHPLYKHIESGQALPMAEVIKHSFVGPDAPLFGKMSLKQSYDGWRDDRYKRDIGYVVPSLQIICEIAESGIALAHLPFSTIKKLNGGILKINDCPFTCRQEVKLVSKASLNAEWIKKLWIDAF